MEKSINIKAPVTLKIFIRVFLLKIVHNHFFVINLHYQFFNDELVYGYSL
jgi:hypothetical protein